jgi:hypothetical protein
MSDYGVSSSEMKRLSNISDGDLDAMRAGHVPHDDPSMEGIARFVRDLGEAFPEPSTADLEDSHVAAMLQAAHLMAENGELVARPASKANGPENQASGLPKPWRETMFGKMLATNTAKVVAGAIALVLAFSGVAIAGVLPAAVQNKVADAVQNVGIDLPGGSSEVDANNIEQGAVNNADEVDVNNADQGAQNNVDEGNVNNADQGAQNNADEADQNNADQSAQDNVDEAVQHNADEGTANNADDGNQNDVHQGAAKTPTGQSSSGGDTQGSGTQNNGGGDGSNNNGNN